MGTTTMPKLQVSVIAANVKKVDPKAYGVTRRDGWVKVTLNDQEFKTKEDPGVLDPKWDEIFELGEVQLGLASEFLLGGLKKGKLTYKGMAVPGGKVDFELRALDFGEEEESEDEDDSFLDFL